jgi:hypothetical protein
MVMKMLALATMLVVGSSTAALAAPLHLGFGSVARAPVHASVAVRPVVREPVRPIVRNEIRPIVREPVRPVLRGGRWFHAPLVLLPAPVIVDVPAYAIAPSPFVDGAETIGLGDATGTGVELNADGGRTFVESALITYTDGNEQSVAVGRELDGASPAVELQTDGSPIASVTVYGMGNGVAAFMV